jgi:SMC interacting uncharacterized protein involved in chromosome segregation
MKSNSIRATIGHKAPTNGKETTHSSFAINSPPKDTRSKDKLNRNSLLYSMGKDLKYQFEDKPKRVYIDQKTVEVYINRLFTFLVASNFDKNLTKGTLKIPSLVLFNNILIFLLNKIDPSLETLEMDSEDFIQVLNAMGSPIPLQKGVFKSLGAPNSWSQALGVLNWLCEFVEEKEELEILVTIDEEPSNQDFNIEEIITNRLVFDYSNADDMLIEGKIIEDLDFRIESFERDIQMSNQATENMLLKMKALTSGQVSVRELENQKMSFEYEREGLLMKCKEVENTIEVMKTDKGELENNIEGIELEIQKSKEKSSVLEEALSKQKINLNEAIEIKGQIMAASQNIDQNKLAIKRNREKMTDIEKSISQLTQQLNNQIERIKENNQIDINNEIFEFIRDGEINDEPFMKILEEISQAIVQEITIIDKELFKLDQQSSQARFKTNQLEKDCWERNSRSDQLRHRIDEIRAEEEKLKIMTKELNNEFSKKSFDISNLVSALNAQIKSREGAIQSLKSSIGSLQEEIHSKEGELATMKRKFTNEKRLVIEKLMDFKKKSVELINVRLQKNLKLLNDLENDS